MRTVTNTLPYNKQAPVSNKSDRLVSDTYIGVEIETENCKLGKNTAKDLFSWWDLTIDNSLKSQFPYEFVFCRPLAGKEIVDALEEMEEKLSLTSAVFPLNTSTHIHVDVTDMSLEEVRRFIYLSIVTESALIQFSGGRHNNSFCVPWFKSSLSHVKNMGNFLDDADGYDTEYNPSWKYSAVNIASVFKLGTLEFRTMEGTKDASRILEWINVILTLKEYAISSTDDPRDSLDYYNSHRDLTDFISGIWGPQIMKRMMHPTLHEDMIKSSLYARLGLYPKKLGELMAWGFSDVVIKGGKEKEIWKGQWVSDPYQFSSDSQGSMHYDPIPGGPSAESIIKSMKAKKPKKVYSYASLDEMVDPSHIPPDWVSSEPDNSES